MITLDPQYIVEAQPTDTLSISQYSIDYVTGEMNATISRGTVVDGQFVSNKPPYIVMVRPDSSFATLDGSYSGTLTGLETLTSTLKGQLEQFILASGLVTGALVTE